MGQGPFITLKDAFTSFFDGLSSTPSPSALYTHLCRPLSALPHNSSITDCPIRKIDPYDPLEIGEFEALTAYILSSLDRVVPTAVQERVVEMYEGKRTALYRLSAGHMWMVVCPELAAGSLVDFWYRIRQTALDAVKIRRGRVIYEDLHIPRPSAVRTEDHQEPKDASFQSSRPA